MSFKQRDEQESTEVESPLLARIKDMLARTPPDKWKSTGSELNPQQKFTLPRETWERTFQISIPNGTLVMRCSQPVRADYYPGGYTYTPVGRPNYTVEVRSSGWNAQEIVDPTFKAGGANPKANKLDVLADGPAAETIYNLVSKTVSKYREEEKKKFDEAGARLLDKLTNTNREKSGENWEKTEKAEKDSSTTVTFTGTIDGIKVEAIKKNPGGKDKFSLIFYKDEMTNEIKDAVKCKEAYDIIEELTKTVRLMALSKVLEDVGF